MRCFYPGHLYIYIYICIYIYFLFVLISACMARSVSGRGVAPNAAAVLCQWTRCGQRYANLLVSKSAESSSRFLYTSIYTYSTTCGSLYIYIFFVSDFCMYSGHDKSVDAVWYFCMYGSLRQWTRCGLSFASYFISYAVCLAS